MVKIPNAKTLAGIIDHTLLNPEATPRDVERLCEEARTYGFCAVCVNPVHVAQAEGLLRGSAVKVDTVVGFPLGANRSSIKARETALAIEEGATEIDMVLNIGALKAREFKILKDDLESVTNLCREGRVCSKVILETCLLTRDEKVTACKASRDAGANFVKTSTGFSREGATTEDISLMHKTVAPELGVKASGGIGTLRDALQMLAAGATRIGASKGIKIIQELTEE